MRTHITAHYRNAIVRLAVEDITHFTSGDKYVTAFHPGGILILSEPLRDLVGEFSEDFIWVHRRHLVRRSCIASLERIDNNCSDIHMHDGRTIPVGRMHRDDVKAMLAMRQQDLGQ